MAEKLRVIVIGCGHMGSSHARAYKSIDAFELVGLVNRTPPKRDALAKELGVTALFDNLDAAIAETKPDVVCVCTYTDTHYEFAKKALNADCHVFLEKPIAENVEQAKEIAELAKAKNKKVVVGYILRQHPAWKKFIEMAQELGKPLVMRMNLNQQSKGAEWQTHKSLMDTMSPIVDCGVHYVDVMCQMTRSKPVSVYAAGARLSDEIDKEMYNYGMLQVTFADGSVGWYEAGWGPMMSETAFFVKDVIGPEGCVSIKADLNTSSDDVDSHTMTNSLIKHSSKLDGDGNFAINDELISTKDEPDHQGLCDLEQEFLLDAIQDDADLSEHLDDAVNSLRIVLAADESVRTGKAIQL